MKSSLSSIVFLYLSTSVVSIVAVKSTSELETNVAGATAITIPMVLRQLAQGVLTHARHAEDSIAENVGNQGEDVRHYTRLLEDVVSPARTTTESVNVDPIPKAEVDKIQTALRTLQDNMWAVKAVEPTFQLQIRTLLNAVRDFSRTTEDKYQQNKHNEESILATSRPFLDVVRRTVRFLEDKVKENNRYLEDNVWKFVRTLEDIAQVIDKSPTFQWKGPKEQQLGELLKMTYTLKDKIEYGSRLFNQAFQVKVAKIEATVNYAVGMLMDTVDATKKTYVPSEPPQIIGLCP